MSRKRVVICEDEGNALLHLRRALEHAGWRVVGPATTGLQTVEVVLRESPDLVLMDLSMPETDGLEASRRVLSTCSVCVLLLTGHEKFEFEAEAKEIGISGYLAKPVMSETLLQAIPQTLEHFADERDNEITHFIAIGWTRAIKRRSETSIRGTGFKGHQDNVDISTTTSP